MVIRTLLETDDRYQLSGVYEQSWKYAYSEIIPQEYLESIPAGRWAAHVDQPGMHTLVAAEGQTIIGTASYCASRFREMNGFGEIVSIYFLPAFTGKGYGGQLLNAAVAGLHAFGYCDIFLWVLEENRRARRFYERCGFCLSDIHMDTEIGGKPLREVQYRYHV